MKNLFRKIKAKTIEAQLSVENAATQVKAAIKDRSGASLWEYLLVIVVVIVIGGAIIGVVGGNNGISKIWSNLMSRFNALING